jgi:predicted transcriptional regulator
MKGRPTKRTPGKVRLTVRLPDDLAKRVMPLARRRKMPLARSISQMVRQHQQARRK